MNSEVDNPRTCELLPIRIGACSCPTRPRYPRSCTRVVGVVICVVFAVSVVIVAMCSAESPVYDGGDGVVDDSGCGIVGVADKPPQEAFIASYVPTLREGVWTIEGVKADAAFEGFANLG